jgi:hypothetical protein
MEKLSYTLEVIIVKYERNWIISKRKWKNLINSNEYEISLIPNSEKH